MAYESAGDYFHRPKSAPGVKGAKRLVPGYADSVVHTVSKDIIGQVAKGIEGDIGLVLKAFAESFNTRAAQNQRFKIREINQLVAEGAQNAIIAAYEATSSAFRPAYRQDDAGKMHRFAAQQMVKALSDPELFAAGPDGIDFIRKDVLDKHAAQWYRLNFGALGVDQGKAGHSRAGKRLQFWGIATGVTLGLQNRPSDPFMIPAGGWSTEHHASSTGQPIQLRAGGGAFYPAGRGVKFTHKSAVEQLKEQQSASRKKFKDKDPKKDTKSEARERRVYESRKNLMDMASSAANDYFKVSRTRQMYNRFFGKFAKNYFLEQSRLGYPKDRRSSKKGSIAGVQDVGYGKRRQRIGSHKSWREQAYGTGYKKLRFGSPGSAIFNKEKKTASGITALHFLEAGVDYITEVWPEEMEFLFEEWVQDAMGDAQDALNAYGHGPLARTGRDKVQASNLWKMIEPYSKLNKYDW